MLAATQGLPRDFLRAGSRRDVSSNSLFRTQREGSTRHFVRITSHVPCHLPRFTTAGDWLSDGGKGASTCLVTFHLTYVLGGIGM